MKLSISIIVAVVIFFNPATIIADNYQPSIEAIAEMQAVDKHFYGYFSIPSLEIGVPTYHMKDARDVEIAQHYTDLENSAVYLDGWAPYMVIADHSNQAFSRLHEVNVGDIAIITYADSYETKYQCTEVEICTRDACDIFDEDGVCWVTWDCQLLTYTCYTVYDPNGVFIAKWEETY